MATSASKNFAVTRDDIITLALRKIGVNDAADVVPPAELAAASLSLNALVKEWSGEGLALWLRQTCVLFLQSGQQRYSVGDGANAYCVPQTAIAFGTLTAGVSTGATLLTVTDWRDYTGAVVAPPITGFTLLRLDSGAMSVETLSAADATTATCTAINGDAASGAKVYLFLSTARVTRPVRVLTVQRLDNSGNSADVELIGRADYERLSRKNASGVPTMLHFDPQLDAAELLVWPVVNDASTDQLVLVLEFYPDDFDAAANNPEFPIEWSNALVWNLAMELSFEYGVDVRSRSQIAQVALSKKQTLFDTADRENNAVTFAVAAR